MASQCSSDFCELEWLYGGQQLPMDEYVNSQPPDSLRTVYLSGHRRDSCSSMIRDSYSMEQRYLHKPRRGWQPSATWYQTEKLILCNWEVPDGEDPVWFS